MARGRLTLATIRGIPVQIHWSTPLGLLFFSGFRPKPFYWLATLLLILVHETGHALVVLAQRQRVRAIELTGFGGLCHWEGRVTPLGRAAIAWGGVWAQLALLVVTLVVLALAGPPRGVVAESFADAFTRANLFLVALNLLPVPPLDGAEAWRLFPELRAWWRRRRTRRAQRREASTRVANQNPRVDSATSREVDAMLERVVRENERRKANERLN